MEMTVANSVDGRDALAIEEEEAAKAYGRAAKSARTRAEYARDWDHFAAWCAERGVASLPASAPAVARYLGTLGGSLKIASIRRRVVAISQQHKERGFDSPTAHKLVREVVTGIARTHGSAQTRKAAITTDILGRLLKALDRETLRGQRDRAILLLGFSGAFRRSELAALDVADLVFDDRGLVVTVPYSKTDQEGQGRQVAVPFVGSDAERCPVTAVREWIRVADIAAGPVFRAFALPRGRYDRFERLKEARMDGRDIARAVQRTAALVGIDGDFAGHSLRAGFVTAAAQKKVPEVDIMRVTGHRSTAVLRRYVRRATLFDLGPGPLHPVDRGIVSGAGLVRWTAAQQFRLAWARNRRRCDLHAAAGNGYCSRDRSVVFDSPKGRGRGEVSIRTLIYPKGCRSCLTQHLNIVCPKNFQSVDG